MDGFGSFLIFTIAQSDCTLWPACIVQTGAADQQPVGMDHDGSAGDDFAWFSHYTANDLLGPRFIMGTVLFVTGVVINWNHDNKLIHLRQPGETIYKVPKGGLFEFVSCPNLLGEIIEWFGFAIMCWNLAAVSFLVWTVANLIPRALSHHKWSKKQFGNYPARRKAIIPFVL